MTDADPFAPLLMPYLGIWVMDPTSCRYESRGAPVAARYTITREGDGLRFTVQWVNAEQQSNELAFDGTPDGQPHTIGDDVTLTTTVTASSLDTTVHRAGERQAHATRRRVGNRLHVTQQQWTDDGHVLSDMAIYDRERHATA